MPLRVCERKPREVSNPGALASGRRVDSSRVRQSPFVPERGRSPSAARRHEVTAGMLSVPCASHALRARNRSRSGSYPHPTATTPLVGELQQLFALAGKTQKKPHAKAAKAAKAKLEEGFCLPAFHPPLVNGSGSGEFHFLRALCALCVRQPFLNCMVST